VSEAIQAITMPKWGLAMDEGVVVEWHVEEGAAIKNGDEILDIETTKITNAMESPVAGTLRRRIAGEGQTLPVGALLGIVAESSVSDADIDAFIERFNEEFAVQAEAGGEGGPEPEKVSAGGVEINYLQVGEGEGPPLVLVHGFGGDLNNWMFNQPALAEAHRVIALDLPGHGHSQKAVGAGDVASFSATLTAFLDALSIDRAHLVGHSLGGAIALHLALEQPDRVASLTLVSPAGLGTDINMDYIRGFIEAGRRKAMTPVLQMLFSDPELVSRDMIEEVLRFKRLDGVEAALRAVAGASFADGRQSTVLADRLGELAMPVQIIWGTDDKILPPSHADNVPEKVTVHRMENVGHMAHMEAAGDVNRLIAEATA
jgi:pyruvate dehydrogenase E2 component (dihydrolipoamide acetyltransferase)